MVPATGSVLIRVAGRHVLAARSPHRLPEFGSGSNRDRFASESYIARRARSVLGDVATDCDQIAKRRWRPDCLNHDLGAGFSSGRAQALKPGCDLGMRYSSPSIEFRQTHGIGRSLGGFVDLEKKQWMTGFHVSNLASSHPFQQSREFADLGVSQISSPNAISVLRR